MRRYAFPAYVAGVVGLAIVASVYQPWYFLATLEPQHLIGVFAFTCLAVLSEYLSIPLVVGKAQGSHSILFLLQFAGVLTVGPAATVSITFVSLALSDFILRHKEFHRALFNTFQHTLAAAAGGLAFTWLGGTPNPDELIFQLVPFLGFGFFTIVTNLTLVCIWLALREWLPLPHVVTRVVGPWGASVAYDLLVSPVAVLISASYTSFWVGGLIGTLFILFFIRRSYLVVFQLQQANRDLLKALVKAIETRDPYTSGHSVRVASLASRVARSMNLSSRAIDHIETAALLHDVGKIDAIYTDILKKPGGLSTEEMEIIRSHVDKGVELLTSLSSFHADVVASVRHHHERFDGGGYPDGLVGEAIPLGARIIKICDAVDAMLSDRPYRKALSLSDVREQLLLFSEREFDPLLVAIALREGLLDAHASHITDSTHSPDLTHAEPTLRPVRVLRG